MNALFDVCHEGHYVSVLPTGVDSSNLIDMTEIGSRFRTYINPRTGEIHDCAVYHQQLVEFVEDLNAREL